MEVTRCPRRDGLRLPALPLRPAAGPGRDIAPNMLENSVHHAQGPRPSLSRRSLLLAAGGAATVLTGCSATADHGTDPKSTAPDGVLAANINANPEVSSFAELKAISATWLRGIQFTDDADKPDFPTGTTMAYLLQAAEHGYGTVLSLSYRYSDKPLPKPRSAQYEREVTRTNAILDKTLGTIDVLVIGNEPFIETRTQDHDRLNAFYQEIARHVMDYRRTKYGEQCRTQLYMGALTSIATPQSHTAAVSEWLAFTKEHTEVQGTDIHPNEATVNESKAYLDYVLPRLRDDQKFLATEFSLVLKWKKHLKDPAPGSLAGELGYSAGTPVWRAVEDMLSHPVDEDQWTRFLLASTWFHESRTYLQQQMEVFRNTGRLAVAAYGLGQNDGQVAQFGPNGTPWILNSLFANRTSRKSGNGLPGRNLTWTRAFQSLQRTQDKRQVH
jgi:hypothetical protein